MPTCEHCGETFDDEDAHAEHLLREHESELSRIDRRRAENVTTGSASDSNLTRRIGRIAIPVVLAIVVAGFLYMVFGTGGGGIVDTGAARQPTDLWSVHEHGTIEMTVLGNPVDFSQSEYQLQADAFHFENNNGERWHVHAKGVTLEFAMATLGIDVTHSSVTYAGTTYANNDSAYAVTIAVNGEDIDPTTYVLQPGDGIVITVENASS